MFDDGGRKHFAPYAEYSNRNCVGNEQKENCTGYCIRVSVALPGTCPKSVAEPVLDIDWRWLDMQGSVRFDNVEKVYGDRVLLSIDTFTVNPGQCILISGDNGSGKTTLLKIMSGLLKPEKQRSQKMTFHYHGLKQNPCCKVRWFIYTKLRICLLPRFLTTSLMDCERPRYLKLK